MIFSIFISSLIHATTQQTFTYSIGSYHLNDPDLEEVCDYEWEDRDECYEHYAVEQYVKLLTHNGKLIKFDEKVLTKDSQTIPLDGYKYGVGRRYITATARVSNDNIIDKPVYFISGFDPENDQGYNDYKYGSGLNVLENTLVNQGFDFIFVDINQDVANSGIFNDTSSFKAFFKAMNLYLGIKSDVNTIIGFSAGGIVARATLKQMENVGDNHYTHTYISYDSPHQGANPTLSAINGISNMKTDTDSFCAIVGYFTTDCVKAKNMFVDIQKQFTNKRAQELLITEDYNYSFYYNLNKLGYPGKTRNIALSNGSNGLEKGYSTGDLLLQKRLDFTLKTETYRFYAEDITSSYKGYFDYSDHRFDNAPGSTSRTLKQIAEKQVDVSSRVNLGAFERYTGDGSNYSNLYTRINYSSSYDANRGTTFIPVVSAFDADTKDLYANVCAAMTPFDAIYSLENSNLHSNLSGHANNILQEINKTLNPNNSIIYAARDTNCSTPVLAECPSRNYMDSDHSSGHLTSQTDTSCSYLVYGSDEDGTDGCTNGWSTTWEDYDEYYHYECEITVPR